MSDISDLIKAIEIVFKNSTLSIKNCYLYLYGSRTDIHKKGGDVDLSLEVPAEIYEQCRALKNQLLVKMKNNIGDQKIDLMIRATGDPLTPFEKVALQSKKLLKHWE